MGTGPGTSGQTARLLDSIIIENSMLQLLISVGIPGLLLFVAFLGSLVWCAWARGDLGVGLAVIGYAIAITGFNSLDAVRNMHILIGFLALLAVHESIAPAKPAPSLSPDHSPRSAASPRVCRPDLRPRSSQSQRRDTQTDRKDRCDCTIARTPAAREKAGRG